MPGVTAAESCERRGAGSGCVEQANDDLYRAAARPVPGLAPEKKRPSMIGAICCARLAAWRS
jgi:hypothetical protein